MVELQPQITRHIAAEMQSTCCAQTIANSIWLRVSVLHHHSSYYFRRSHQTGPIHFHRTPHACVCACIFAQSVPLRAIMHMTRPSVAFAFCSSI